MDTQSHWQEIYGTKPPDEQTWYQESPEASLELIERHADSREARVIDAGGGCSTLVDHLLARGTYDVTVLDIAPAALEAAKRRLGERADEVEWVVADLTESLALEQTFDVWHDRAVFHFLTDEADRRRYVENLEGHVPEGGVAIISTFAPDGPESCSGLSVRRYAPAELASYLGEGWQLLEPERELHQTPWGGEQAFAYAALRRM